MTTLHRDDRWNTGLVGALSLVAVGLAYADATLVVAAVIPLAYVLYGSFSSLPPSASLALSREFDPAAPAPGERVTVTLTVRNDGDRTLADVRVVDGVPDALAVESGSPRACLSLAAGDAATLSYEVVATRGEFAFADAVVRLRSTAGSSVATDEMPVAGDDTLSCTGRPEGVPLAEAAPGRVGTVPADAGGSGLEFYATREYRPGDSLSRVDWRHLAKTGELTTVEFREERASTVAVVADVRRPTRVVSGPGRPTAGERCAYAAVRTHGALAAAGHAAEATVLGLDAERVPDAVAVGPDGLPWPDGPQTTAAVFEAGGAAASRESAAETAATAETAEATETAGKAETAETTATDGGRGRTTARFTSAASEDAETPRRSTHGRSLAATLDARFASDARVVIFSPLLDDYPVALARALRRRGRTVAVLSPDATGRETPGLALAALDRHGRRTSLERDGVTVADWTPTRPLDDALAHALSDR
ncbi:DUF58 domain-containing protein [Halogeometricum limi]|uniref:Conserved repeat domain-containing protein n=1 Tax=Halogeometricum limi TaxID=555875 RepID=A0A1I6ILS3_9EURY|nr:DUF58 domain-containing protein [Halogeometricum limi]SFR67634.1 conserved repeat domain-containing protein [Halogeometricum limi]